MLIDSVIPTAIPGSRVRVYLGPGQLDSLGELAAAEGARRVLVVTDPGIVAAGHAERALGSLRKASLETVLFAGVGENPTTAHVAAGLAVAREHAVDFLVALGGGSAMDAAKGLNFLCTNGGAMQDYWGVGKATRPMLPLIAIPTTAGTGSDAQSFALITDPVTHQKMACGDPKALPRIAILDPDLAATCPPRVAAATGIDAIAHAIETSASTKRTAVSRALSKQAWDLLAKAFPSVLASPSKIKNQKSRIADMLLGAHLAGAAIENSMLGAAHACANPLTARFGIVHGLAVGLMLPHVIRYNTQAANPYGDLEPDPVNLLDRLDGLLTVANLPRSLQELSVPRDALPELAALAACQWTAAFNPRPVTAGDFLTLYENAWPR